jgi:hypothetical protein
MRHLPARTAIHMEDQALEGRPPHRLGGAPGAVEAAIRAAIRAAIKVVGMAAVMAAEAIVVAAAVMYRMFPRKQRGL